MEKLSDKLPAKFVLNMKAQLGEAYSKYENAVNEQPVRAIRVNTKKISCDSLVKRESFQDKLTKIDYEPNGYVFSGDEKIGFTPEHLSGLVYVQEPSSMIAVASSGISKEQRALKVLDLCAAPGGKTGQIACNVSDDSIIFSNEIIKSRANILFSNVERQGFNNVVVLNEEPANLLCFKGYFDYVFVDAPCSGEGMFRKNPETISEWSEDNIKLCESRQKEILEIAEALVCAGGKLIYSTCTFNETEDEGIVNWFLDSFNYELANVDDKVKKSTLPSKVKHKNSDYARKFYPFTACGEGQFVAVFQNKDDERSNDLFSRKHFSCIKQIGQSENKLVAEFAEQSLNIKFDWHRLYRVGDNIFLAPQGFDASMQTALENLKFVTLGIKLGSIEKNRFEPNHNMFMALEDCFKTKIELSQGDYQKYLHGEELPYAQGGKGYAVVTVNGYAIGGVKIAQNRLKNLYPKGMRI